ncbi:penicillin-binding protein [Burkholderia pseudomallei]|nr:penicillin-binding protein [Burkholderia pseudomallei]
MWFAGYSSGVVSVVWMGYDAPRSLGRATGSSAALPVWVDYMKTAVDGRGAIERTPPADVALVDGDFVYAEYANGDKCASSLPPFVRSPFACGAARGAPADGGAPASAAGAAGAPTPAAVDAAERARVLELFRTED